MLGSDMSLEKKVIFAILGFLLIFFGVSAFVLWWAIWMASAPDPLAEPEAEINFYDLLKSPNADWLTYGGDYGSKRYSPLFNINQSNVSNLQLQWAYQMPNEDSNLRVTPLVYEGVMYITNAYEVEALDAVTGTLLWAWHDEGYPETWMNRGAALLGDKVFFVTLDCALVALDRKTGQLQWRQKFVDDKSLYHCTVAPLALKDRLVVGVSTERKTVGQEGAKGFVLALASSDGRELWRFWTVFEQDLVQGGAATWTTGSYDPELDLLYWATGAPNPGYETEDHPLDDKYFNSVIALDSGTGRKKWHYQFTPRDSHHWDANEPLVIADVVWKNNPRYLMQANRNGYFYILDKKSGGLQFKKPFVQIKSDLCPGVLGATNWMSSSHSLASELFYVNALESCGNEPGTHFLRAISPLTGEKLWEYKMGSGSMYAGVMTTAGGLVFTGDDAKHFLALNDRWGTLLWKYPLDEAVFASPISYAVNGRQYVTIAAGPKIFTFGLPD